jgi:ABC-type transport system substrate-binding protein
MPLTAEDVAFTFLYQFESGMLGGSIDPPELVLVDSPNPYRVILEYSTESYWHFSDFAFDYIIPEHIFNDDTGIGYDGWDDWNPIYDPSEPFVTCGPFVVSNFEAGDFLELFHNSDFYYRDNSRYIDENLSISSSDEILIYRGTTGNEIVWEIYGTHGTYWISRNGTLRESGSWPGGDIRHNIDGLDIGTYSFTLTVDTTSGYSASDTVLVYVREQGVPQPPLNILTISISSISAVVIVMAIVAIYRDKKIQEG